MVDDTDIERELELEVTEAPGSPVGPPAADEFPLARVRKSQTAPDPEVPSTEIFLAPRRGTITDPLPHGGDVGRPIALAGEPCFHERPEPRSVMAVTTSTTTSTTATTTEAPAPVVGAPPAALPRDPLLGRPPFVLTMDCTPLQERGPLRHVTAAISFDENELYRFAEGLVHAEDFTVTTGPVEGGRSSVTIVDYPEWARGPSSASRFQLRDDRGRPLMHIARGEPCAQYLVQPGSARVFLPGGWISLRASSAPVPLLAVEWEGTTVLTEPRPSPPGAPSPEGTEAGAARGGKEGGSTDDALVEEESENANEELPAPMGASGEE